MILKPGKNDIRFIGAIALVHIVFFLLACRYTRIYMGDSYEYIYEAVNIKQLLFFYSGNPAMPILPEYMTQRQPGYPLFLLSVYLFSVNNWIVIILQNMISIGNIVYCRAIFLKAGLSRKYDWLLLLFVVAYPSQFINANTIAPDILLQTCALFYFGNFVELWRSKQLRNAGYMSLWLVAGMMVKPVFYPFVIVHFGLLSLFFMRAKMKMQRPVLIALIPVCAVLLYNYSNYTRTGKFHFSSNQSFNAIYYFHHYYSNAYGADNAAQFLAKERATTNAFGDYADRYDHANKRGVALLKKNFLPYMSFHIQNTLRIFVEPGKAEMDLFTGQLTYGKLYSAQQTGFFATLKRDGWSGLGRYIEDNPSMPLVLIVFIFNCIRGMGLALFLLSKNRSQWMRAFVFIFIGYFAFAAGPIANTRYFLPVSLIASCCAVVGFTSWKSSDKQPAI